MPNDEPKRGQAQSRYPQTRDLSARAAVRRPQFRLHPGAVRAVPGSARVGRPGSARALERTPEKLESSPVVQRVRGALPWRRERRQRSSCRRRGGRAPQQLLGAVAAGDGARQGASHARPSRRAPRPARRRAARRSRARAERLEPDADAGAAGRRFPRGLLRVHVPGETLADALPRLRETYCGTIAYEIEHISDHEQRVWLREAIESGRYRTPLDRGRAARAAQRADRGRGDGALPAARRSSARSSSRSRASTSMVPMLDEAIELAADGRRARGRHRHGAPRPAQRARAHASAGPYDAILREFEGERTLEAVGADPEGGTGDVKYHLGARASARPRRAR